jgi:poly(A) polymerase
MKIVRTIEYPQWIYKRALGELFHTLKDRGVTTRLVGGAVREAVQPVGTLHEPDLDCAIDIPPEEFITICDSLEITTIPTGIDFGTVTIRLNGESFEFTSLRKDVETDGRRAVVEYTKDWNEDALRRDLTINALYADWDGSVYDPLGNGIKDLSNHYLRFIGNPEDRIKEDYLRIIRFFRFLGLFKEPQFDPQLISMFHKYSNELASVSKERKWAEILKTYRNPYFINTFEYAYKEDILPKWCDLDWSIENIRASEPWLRNSTEDAILPIFCGIASFPKKSFDSVPKKIAARIKKAIVDEIPELNHEELYWTAPSVLMDRIQRATMISLPHSDDNVTACQALMEKVMLYERPQFPISGQDLLVLGMREGVELGRILRATEEWWVSQKCLPSKDNCLDYIKQIR